MKRQPTQLTPPLNQQKCIHRLINALYYTPWPYFTSNKDVPWSDLPFIQKLMRFLCMEFVLKKILLKEFSIYLMRFTLFTVDVVHWNGWMLCAFNGEVRPLCSLQWNKCTSHEQLSLHIVRSPETFHIPCTRSLYLIILWEMLSISQSS